MKAIRRSRAAGGTGTAHRANPWPGSVARAEDLFAGCVRECAGFLSRVPDGMGGAGGTVGTGGAGGAGGVAGPETGRLVAAVGELVRERAEIEPCQDRSFAALLRAGDAAIAAGQVRLARRLADAAVALRTRSAAAWLLRGRALSVDGRVREASDAYRRHRALAEDDAPERAPLALAPEPMTIDGLRTWLAGRRVCVVGGGEAVAASGLGPRIDTYDLVMRLDSHPLHPPGTGERTDLHAVSHASAGPGWRRRAEVRLVFGERAEQWAEAVSLRLVPGAQSYLGDRGLSHPVRDPALLAEPRWATDPTTGFSLIRLLDHLDVNPTIDIVGLGLPGQLRPEEHHWLRAKGTTGATGAFGAVAGSGLITSLR
ncbi:hypothetical protein FH609_020870 [Streptomyces sp. 3MP-14]|uniref:Uncharacterized protein n=1 Tax=Streptomyces mimosae TaxID=2586635 RepID=A0A5N6A219_9ACTN|nr:MULTISPECIES: glycosyltransferase family 29 protein [Streptomyces]KAB8161710.1 hypothetical protein FH607_023550 [Streptomyces mimosae]KAB8175022.1 hypothetical protein FH609_020870 [Streptomyces sp. 3MP-14]